MSMLSKWRQFVRWVREHQTKDEFADNMDFHPEDTSQGALRNEYSADSAAAEEKNLNDNWPLLGAFYFAYLDITTGSGDGSTYRDIVDGKMKPNSGPITGNNETDMLILTAGVIGGIVALWYIIKKLL